MEFDNTKLKKRPAYPFETIAVALGFSPRLEAVLSESKRLAETLKSSLLLIHIGSKTDTKEDRLEKMMLKLGLDPAHVRVIWMEGNAVESILRLCKLNIVDLLIIGALEKENILKFYTGSVARKISRKAKCSVLLLTQPHLDASKPKRIIVSGIESPKTINTMNTAFYLAEKYKVDEITIVKEVDTPLTFAIAEDNTAPETREMKKNLTGVEEKKLDEILKKCDKKNINVIEKILTGKQGYAISKYARDKKADLLVVNSPDKHLNLLDRIFTHDLEYILADLPCNVMIVHSRI